MNEASKRKLMIDWANIHRRAAEGYEQRIAAGERLWQFLRIGDDLYIREPDWTLGAQALGLWFEYWEILDRVPPR
jgi:hypothetical protein